MENIIDLPLLPLRGEAETYGRLAIGPINQVGHELILIYDTSII